MKEKKVIQMDKRWAEGIICDGRTVRLAMTIYDTNGLRLLAWSGKIINNGRERVKFVGPSSRLNILYRGMGISQDAISKDEDYIQPWLVDKNQSKFSFANCHGIARRLPS